MSDHTSVMSPSDLLFSHLLTRFTLSLVSQQLKIPKTRTTFGVVTAVPYSGGTRGAAAPGPAVSGAHKWWKWTIFMCCFRSVRGPHLAQHPGPH